jgi:hypothetical protein
MDSFRYTMQSSCHAAGGDEGAICSFDMKKGCVNAPHSKIRTADGVEYCNAPKRERKHVFGPVFSSKHDRFTKTGSGQTQGRLQNQDRFSGVCLADDLGGSEINTCTDNAKAKCDVWSIDAAGHTVKSSSKVYYQECLLRSTSLLH